MILPEEFYFADAVTAARELIGKRLTSTLGGATVSGTIVEAEAYRGRLDPAAHSYRGRTERVRALYEGKGLAYIYLIYGMYWCLNLSCGGPGEPECVLIRALEPVEGVDIMRKRRGTERVTSLCSGPGKVCMALGVDKSAYGCRVWDPASPITVWDGEGEAEVAASPRIGIDYAGEARDWPWRFTAAGNRFVSR